MASQNNNATAAANNQDVIGSNGSVGAIANVPSTSTLPILPGPPMVGGNNGVNGAVNVAKDFTLFGHLPTELRLMVWEFAMEMEGPRLVHLRANGCSGLRGHRRRGCPRTRGLQLTLDGVKYEQVPSYFVVSHECRYIAVRHYSIRFTVTQDFLAPTNKFQRVTNIIMSPDDILVSWHPEHLLAGFMGHFDIEFSPEARRVRNIMVNPWRTTIGVSTFEMVNRLVALIGNVDTLEKVYQLRTRVRGPLRYGGNDRDAIDELAVYVILRRIISRSLKDRLNAMHRDSRPQWLYADAA
ncbi:hypothetical protein F4859DRAFT_511784 [Xylaria cf. heliscus]|nr:hypothetical protein F4859DRAFT_511784 [Xylaria cf. heliscus]